jgi:hypothetical protein
MADALLTRGVEIKEEMFGPEHGQIKLDRATDFTREFEELVARYCFAEVWGREAAKAKKPKLADSAFRVALSQYPNDAHAKIGGAGQWPASSLE